MKTIFELCCIEICDYANRYPRRDAYMDSVGFYSTLEKAEKAILKEMESNYQANFGYIIKEKLLDAHCTDPLTIRNYRPDGSFLSFTDSPDHTEGKFAGRRSEDILFRRGDIVEYLVPENNKARLGIILSTPRTLGEPLNPNPHGDYVGDNYFPFALDANDDCYYVATFDRGKRFKDFISVPFIFPPQKKVSMALRRKLQEYLK